MAHPEGSVEPVDAFDLPPWIGEERVVWVAEESMGQPTVAGTLNGPGGRAHACDLVAGDHAYPVVALDEPRRRAMHQAWRLGQVLLVSREGRLTLAAPGSEVHAGLALEAVARLAKAVGAPTDRFSVTLRL